MTRVRIVSIKKMPWQSRDLCRKVKERTGFVADRYTDPISGEPRWHVVLDGAGWSVKARPECFVEIDQNSQIEAEREEERRRMIVQDYISEGLGE